MLLFCLAVEGRRLANKVKFEMDNLTKLLRSLKQDDNKIIRVGIIGSKAKSDHGGLTNAELGTFHEFGGKGGKRPPRRSFLAEPLSMKLNISKDKGLKKSAFKNLFKKNKADTFLADLGAKAVQIVEGAFLTAGYGTWKPLAAATWASWEKKKGIKGWQTGNIARFRKGLRMSLDRTPLIDTGKLKGSISFKVIKKK